jgi:hypothetical protein
MSMMKVSVLILFGIASMSGMTALQTLGHAHQGHAHGHEHHIHAHSHDGHVHSHEHSHPAHEQHPEHDSSGDHHECASGHGDPVPVLLIASSRDWRRPTETKFLAVKAAVSWSPRIETDGLAPPERPPQSPTSQDSLPQLRTVVLLT